MKKISGKWIMVILLLCVSLVSMAGAAPTIDVSPYNIAPGGGTITVSITGLEDASQVNLKLLNAIYKPGSTYSFQETNLIFPINLTNADFVVSNQNTATNILNITNTIGMDTTYLNTSGNSDGSGFWSYSKTGSGYNINGTYDLIWLHGTTMTGATEIINTMEWNGTKKSDGIRTFSIPVTVQDISSGSVVVTLKVNGSQVGTDQTVLIGNLTKIGVYRDGAWLLDFTGSGTWGSGSKNYGFGDPGWNATLGDWKGDGLTEIGIYRDGNWLLDFDGNGSWSAGDKNYAFGNVSWTPIVGTWNGSIYSQIGVYKDGTWLLDFDGTGSWTPGDKNYVFGEPGWTPVVGNWNGTSFSQIGVYRNGNWLLDYDGTGSWSAGDKNYAFGGAGWLPMTGDWNSDGFTEVGVYKDGNWLLDYDGTGSWSAGDKNYAFGAIGWLPIVGDWNGDTYTKVGVYKDGNWLLDYDGTGSWNILDKNYAFGDVGWLPVHARWN